MGGDTSPEQQYSLRWNDFHSSILSSFRHLRDAEDFVDVTLACDGCSFTAHKVVLSACSPYFRSLLKANPCQHPIVILRDVQQKDMESLLRFMYNGEVHVGQEHLTDFLKTAQMLQVRGLADVQRLTPSEHKISPTSPSTALPWPPDRVSLAPHDPDDLRSPPSKRPRSLDDRPESPLGNSQTPPAQRNGNAHLHQQESLLGQALEGGPTIITKEQKLNSDSSMLAQSAGEDSTAASDSDTAATSDGGGGTPGGGGGGDERRLGDHEPPVTPKTEPADYPPHMDDPHHPFGSNGGLMDPSRGGFTGALLGIPGLGGLMPGPSGMHNSPDSFAVSRRSMDMLRVRATDPRPCPKCGKIYRSAHTLRTHLEDKHTVCPGYRCVLCGTVAKSRNSLHSHMSRQHRGISTKDLPVLPMPAPFDPELASRLLAKAGVKISAAELRARASPTGPRRSDVKLDAKSAYGGGGSEAGSSVCGDNDPEDLTTSSHPAARYGGGLDFSRDFSSPPLNHHQNSNYGGNRSNQALAAKSIDSLQILSKEPYPAPLAPPPVSSVGANSTTGSAILDTYIQFITENSLGMAGMMTSEQQQAAAAAAVQAAKLAQLNAMGAAMDKQQQQHFLEKMQQLQQQQNAVAGADHLMIKRDEIRRGEAEMVNNQNQADHNEEDSSAGEEDDYSEDEIDPPEPVKASGEQCT